MDQKLKNEILASAKTNRVHKIPIVESPFEPEERNVIWLNDGVMYYFNNGEWESLYSTSGGDTPEPEPEPLDPKYVVTPIEFVNFESKSMTMGGESFSYNFSDMISVQEEATEYQEGSILTWKAPGGPDSTVRDTPTLINEDSTGNNAEMFSAMQQILSVAYPNNTIELVSITDYRTYEASIVIAEVDGSRKTFIVEYFNEAPVEGQSYTMDPPAEPAVNETYFLTPFPQNKYPVEGFTPIVVFKREDAGENKTYAGVGFYKLSDDPYDAFMEFDDGLYHYYPAINASNNNNYSGLAVIFNIFPSTFPTEGINSLLPAGNQYMGYAFGNDYEVDIAKYPEDINKRIIVILFKQPYEMSGTGLSDEDILKDFFDVDDISSITPDYLGLYGRSNFG